LHGCLLTLPRTMWATCSLAMATSSPRLIALPMLRRISWRRLLPIRSGSRRRSESKSSKWLLGLGSWRCGLARLRPWHLALCALIRRVRCLGIGAATGVILLLQLGVPERLPRRGGVQDLPCSARLNLADTCSSGGMAVGFVLCAGGRRLLGRPLRLAAATAQPLCDGLSVLAVMLLLGGLMAADTGDSLLVRSCGATAAVPMPRRMRWAWPSHVLVAHQTFRRQPVFADCGKGGTPCLVHTCVRLRCRNPDRSSMAGRRCQLMVHSC